MTALARRLERVEARALDRLWAKYWDRIRDVEALEERFCSCDPSAARLMDDLCDLVDASALMPPAAFLNGHEEEARGSGWRILHQPGASELYREIRRRWDRAMSEPWPWQGDDLWWPND